MPRLLRQSSKSWPSLIVIQQIRQLAGRVLSDLVPTTTTRQPRADAEPAELEHATFFRDFCIAHVGDFWRSPTMPVSETAYITIVAVNDHSRHGSRTSRNDVFAGRVQPR